MKKVLSTGLALSLIAGIGTTGLSPAHASAKIQNHIQAKMADFSYTSQQTAALNYLNSIRAKMGLPAVKLNPFLNKSALSHAKFLSMNGYDYAHSEKKGLQGFTGEDVESREKAAGAPTNITDFAGEVITFDTTDYKNAINDFMLTAYHRTCLTDPTISDVGFGSDGFTTVIDTSSDGNTPSTYYGESFYPYDGMTNVRIGFYGFESPNPIAKFGVNRTGSIISYLPAETVINNITAVITDSTGAEVPFFSEKDTPGNWYFYPKYELAYGETYKVSLKYYNDIENVTKNTTWSFTTQQKPSPAPDDSLNGSTAESDLKINGKYVPTKVSRVNESVYYDYSSITKSGVTYIPATYIFNRLNATSFTNSKTKTTIYKTKSHTISYTEGAPTVTVNGKSLKLSQKPIKIGNYLYVPLSFLSTTMGVTSSYNSHSHLTSLSANLDDPYNFNENLVAQN